MKKQHNKKKEKRNILIITGEHSGELLAVEVVKELKKTQSVHLIGTGGELLKKEGMELLETIDKMAVIGIMEALKSYPFLKKLLKKILLTIQEKKIQYVILVDYPGFNLRLARAIKKINPQIFIFYLVSPQIWAWNYKRMKTIKKNINLMMTLFEFEKRIYDSENVPSVWIGHPMKYRIPRELRKQPSIPTQGKPTIGILPGSRYSEVSQLLIPMLDSAQIIKKTYPQTQFFLAIASNDYRIQKYIQKQLILYKDLNIKAYTNSSLQIMKISDLLITASGTATLEIAYFKKPMVICYRISNFNYLLIASLLKTKYIGLPNLLCKNQVATELLQNEVTPENIYHEVKKILDNEEYRNYIIKNLKNIQFTPQNQNPAKLAAKVIHSTIQ